MGKVITDRGIHNIKVPAGYLYYSKEQRTKLSIDGSPRFFGELVFDNGSTEIVEYTEMIDFATAKDHPDIGPWEYNDVVFLGKGIFHHSEES